MIANKKIIWERDFSEDSKKPQLFTGLGEASLQKLMENSTLQNYESKQLLVQQGDEPTHMYFIVKGALRAFRTSEDGAETTISMLEKGSICMEAVLFMGGPSPISIQVLETTQLMLVPRTFVKNFVIQDQQFATNLLKIVAQHYKTAMHQVDAMAIKSPVQRVGYYFLQQHIEQGSESMEFELSFRKSMIANHLGITPETFSRALCQIKKMGVYVDGENIKMKDAYALCHFCDLEAAHDCTLSNKSECSHCPLSTEKSYH